MAINSIVVDPNNNASGKPNLTMILATGLIAAVYELREDLDPSYDFCNPDEEQAEVGAEIDWVNETGFTSNPDETLYTFNALGIRIALKRVNVGDMTVNVTITPIDTTTSATPDNTLTAESAPAKLYNIPVGDKVAEKVRVKVSGKNSVFLNKLVLWVSDRAKLRPRT